MRDALKVELGSRGLTKAVRANNAGCLDACASGAVLVIYPEQIWYGGVTPADVPEIVEKTIVNGEVIERLLLKEPQYRPAAMQFPRLEP